MIQRNSTPCGPETIYTLAENGTSQSEKQAIILTGKGADMTAADYGMRRSKKKMITQALILKMIDIAKKERNSDMETSLWNTYHCLDKVVTHENRLHGKYCKNRFCTTCLGIRKAEMINKYYPVLKEWEDPYFVTLTVKSVYRKDLKLILKKCIQGLNRIIDKYEKRAYRGKDKKLVGLRSLECNFNPNRKTYNPHLHLLVPDKATAEILKQEWLSLWTSKPTERIWVSPKGQDIRKVDDLDKGLVEIIKYGTKVFTDVEEERKLKNSVKLYAKAFYNIIEAMKGIRLLGSFGFKLPKGQENKAIGKVVTDYEEWRYQPEYLDWQHTESEQTLFGYLPQQVLSKLLGEHIDVITE